MDINFYPLFLKSVYNLFPIVDNFCGFLLFFYFYSLFWYFYKLKNGYLFFIFHFSTKIPLFIPPKKQTYKHPCPQTKTLLL